MKIGTDSILLGSWTENKAAQKILDIGTGTGILSLMLAQKNTRAQITAIDNDQNAYQLSQKNFQTSQWGDRLLALHFSFQEFIQKNNQKYDLIVSNPPFFIASLLSSDSKKNNMRHQCNLTIEELLRGASQLLTEKGMFNLILPVDQLNKVIDNLTGNSLYLNRICSVKPNQNLPAKRVLLSMSPKKQNLQEESLVIEIKRHQYTEEYLALTKGFYLKD